MPCQASSALIVTLRLVPHWWPVAHGRLAGVLYGGYTGGSHSVLLTMYPTGKRSSSGLAFG